MVVRAFSGDGRMSLGALAWLQGCMWMKYIRYPDMPNFLNQFSHFAWPLCVATDRWSRDSSDNKVDFH